MRPPRASLLVALLVAVAGLCGAPPLPAATSSTLHREQLRAVAVAVARMGPRAPGANVYFVGFAGYGEQRVFRREEELARRVLGGRFGALDHSVQLVNDVHDRHAYPLATFPNLREAVRLVGERMNRAEDVLVLMLTSHGSAQDGIAVTNGRLVDDALSPQDVRQVLDAAGIRWRIVVVSACYAGIFIPVLKSDTTLVMTAADARHSSFGCADDRDLTYFGEALLQDALPHACSLPAAFTDAQQIIRQRESAEGEIHSNPQMYVGRAMRAKLVQLDAARAAARCAAGPAPNPRPERSGPSRQP
ncbi:MAG TPA: C13 family peptidase [Steroidobacteraceae bacterium]|nr:C13 family peptidase [Steroidobacteraceae bacterium]